METLYDLIRKEKVGTSEGIRYFGCTYEYEVYETLAEKMPEFTSNFLSLLDNTLTTMMFSHYMLSPVMGGVNGDNVIEIALEPRVKYLAEVPEGGLPPTEPPISSLPDGVPIRVDLDKVVIKLLCAPTSVELALIGNKRRVLFLVYFNLTYLNQNMP